MFLPLAGCLQLEDQPAMGQSGEEGVTEGDVGVDLPLGDGLIANHVVGPTVSYFEPGDGVCALPNGFAFGSDDGTFSVGINFDGALIGAHDVTATLAGRDAEGEATIFTQSVSLEIDGELFVAMSGTVRVAEGEEADTLVTTLEEVVVESVSTEGTHTLDAELIATPVVQCQVRVEDACGWILETAPYVSAFCQDATESYSEGVLH